MFQKIDVEGNSKELKSNKKGVESTKIQRPFMLISN
jgi:hypothetical protein